MSKKKQWILSVVFIISGIVLLAVSAAIKEDIGYVSSRRMAASGYPAILGAILLALGIYGICKLKKGQELLFWKAVWDLIAKNDDKALYKALDIEEQWEEKQKNNENQERFYGR